MLAGIEKRASVWSVNVETIEDSLNKLSEEYPNTEAAGKVEAFRIEYPTTLKAAIEAHEEQIIEDEATKMFASIEDDAFEWSSTEAGIELSLKKILELYPNTKAAGRVEVFRERYPQFLKTAKEQHNKQIAEEAELKAKEAVVKAKEEAPFKAIMRSEFGNLDNFDYWYNYFTEEGKEKIYNNEVRIGDGDSIITFLKGYYEMTTTETAFGKSNQFYGSSDSCRYTYLTYSAGIIDYIAY